MGSSVKHTVEMLVAMSAVKVADGHRLLSSQPASYTGAAAGVDNALRTLDKHQHDTISNTQRAWWPLSKRSLVQYHSKEVTL